MVEQSKAKLIADHIIAECQSNEPAVDSRSALIAITRATGEFLAHFEASAPDAVHLYMTALRTNLRAARHMHGGNPKRKVPMPGLSSAKDRSSI
ncbi:MAG TPA: hypothetical protein VFK79_07385 [Xanthobacteraceae bacterium]|nr:hypothetical protein [Xanthobacteraceae bacterium]